MASKSCIFTPGMLLACIVCFNVLCASGTSALKSLSWSANRSSIFILLAVGYAFDTSIESAA